MLDLRAIIACLVLASMPTSIILLVVQFYTLGTISIYLLFSLCLNSFTLNYFYRDVVADIYTNIRKNYFERRG